MSSHMMKDIFVLACQSQPASTAALPALVFAACAGKAPPAVGMDDPGGTCPATRNQTSDHLMPALVYSQMLCQLSYGRLAKGLHGSCQLLQPSQGSAPGERAKLYSLCVFFPGPIFYVCCDVPQAPSRDPCELTHDGGHLCPCMPAQLCAGTCWLAAAAALPFLVLAVCAAEVCAPWSVGRLPVTCPAACCLLLLMLLQLVLLLLQSQGLLIV